MVSTNGVAQPFSDDSFTTIPVEVDNPVEVRVEWQDELGLTGKQPLILSIDPIDDAPPLVSCDGLPRRKVLLDTEIITFNVVATDDFGVKQVGLEWNQIDDQRTELGSGETIIGAGNTDADMLELAATFCAADLNVQSKLVSVRVFAEDYLPERARSYSAESIFEILSADQHANLGDLTTNSLATNVVGWARQRIAVARYQSAVTRVV